MAALIIVTNMMLFAAKANADLMNISAADDDKDKIELKNVSAKVNMQ